MGYDDSGLMLFLFAWVAFIAALGIPADEAE